MTWKSNVGAIALGLLIAVPALAETLYVVDELVITVRAQPDSRAEIVESLRTGASVEVLERPAGSSFIRVRTESGVEGWSLEQYLTNRPIARTQLAEAQAALRRANQQVATLRERADAAEAELAEARQTLSQATRSSTALSEELAELREISGSAVETRQELERASERLRLADAEVERLLRENDMLTDESRRRWFLIGGGVLGAGVILGLILPSLRRKKRWDW